MSLPATPQNFFCQQGNATAQLQWDQVAGAISYIVQRSTDGLNFTSLSTIAASANPQYIDTNVVYGTIYYYQVASFDGASHSLFTSSQSVVPTQNGEMSLGELRTQSQQRADRLNSGFLTTAEWNTNINQSMTELYDLLVDTYEDYFVAEPFQFRSDGSTFRYALPTGQGGPVSFFDMNNTPVTPPPFYKLMGVDLAVNNANNAYVSINKFNVMDRNRFVYPNTASTIYGVFNLQYRLMGNAIEFIPTPTANQTIRIWMIPRIPKLLGDSDITTAGISGWLEYVITDAAIKALQKEESDVTVLAAQKMALIKRIQDSAMNRDAGQPDRVTDVFQGSRAGYGNGWGGANGPVGGL
jgi:hypothetical protein